MDDDLRAYVAEAAGHPVFTDRRWTIGGVVSLNPAPPPRRASLDLTAAPSSRWRKRRYSMGGTSTQGGERGTAAAPTSSSENVDPQLRFVTMRSKGGSKGLSDPDSSPLARLRRHTRRSRGLAGVGQLARPCESCKLCTSRPSMRLQTQLVLGGRFHLRMISGFLQHLYGQL